MARSPAAAIRRRRWPRTARLLLSAGGACAFPAPRPRHFAVCVWDVAPTNAVAACSNKTYDIRWLCGTPSVVVERVVSFLQSISFERATGINSLLTFLILGDYGPGLDEPLDNTDSGLVFPALALQAARYWTGVDPRPTGHATKCKHPRATEPIVFSVVCPKRCREKPQ